MPFRAPIWTCSPLDQKHILTGADCMIHVAKGLCHVHRGSHREGVEGERKRGGLLLLKKRAKGSAKTLPLGGRKPVKTPSTLWKFNQTSAPGRSGKPAAVAVDRLEEGQTGRQDKTEPRSPAVFKTLPLIHYWARSSSTHRWAFLSC